MLPLSPTLLAHQRGQRRAPAVLVTASRSREGLPVVDFAPLALPGGTPGPHALAVTAGGTFLQAWNDAGTVRTRRDWGAWSAAVASAAPGSAVALATVPGEVVLAIADGAAVRTLSSFDDGLTWSAPVTRASEAGAVGALALAGRQSNGNLCLFYTLAGTATVKRLRRTGGTWAASGTAWTAGGAWAEVTGLAAIHLPNDYHLVVTGTAAGGEAMVAAHLMGDGTLPANAWFGPQVIALADAGAAIAFSHPAVAHPGGLVAAWRQRHAAEAPHDRPMLARAVSGTLAPWSEPAPFAAEAPYGLAVAAGAGIAAATPHAAWTAPPGETLDLSDRLLALRREDGPTRSALALLLDDREGTLGGHPLLRPGCAIEARLGYRSGPGGAPEYGLTLRCAILRARSGLERGRRFVSVEAGGPWEQLAAARLPAAWQSPPGATRGELAALLAARAGIPIVAAADLPPSGAWTTESAALALPAGASLRDGLLRLLASTPDWLRADAGLAVCGTSPADPAAEVYGPGGHPILAFEAAREALANWARLQGPDRYAEAVAGGEAVVAGPALALRRDFDAATSARAESAAAALLGRERLARPLARLRAPFHAGQQLYDVVTVEHPLAGPGPRAFRVIGIVHAYRAGEQFETILELGEVG